MGNILEQKFFNRETAMVAQELLGKFLVRRAGEQKIAAMIIETEVYDGLEDRASHAFSGRTKRTEVMFGHPGFWYVYLCYGIHYMLNVVAREKDYPAAVLIRGIEIDGKKLHGPGKVTKALRIGKELNLQQAQQKSGLWIEDRNVVISPKSIASAARIGIDYAGPLWAGKKLRFFLEDNV